MFWSQDWTWSLPVIALTIVVHVIVLGFATTKSVAILSLPARHGEFMLRFCVIIGAIALLASLLLAIEAALCAAAYRHVGALSDFGTAMLDSLGAITSYGHVEVLLAPRWRLMGAIEALNGIMLFGLTTAFFFDVIQTVRPLARR